MNVMYAYFFMPAGFLRVQESSKESNAGDWKKFQSWYVPIDDTHTLRFQAAFAPFEGHGVPYEWPVDPDFLAPGPWNDYFRDYERYDTISGIPVNAPGTAIKGFLAQDSMVNESQGPIVDRSLEHLTGHDHVLTAMRKIMLQAIEDVQGGRDPKHVIRDPEFNDIVYVGGVDEFERV
jgi:5,5'-dehydrodivanillate O-demethylase